MDERKIERAGPPTPKTGGVALFVLPPVRGPVMRGIGRVGVRRPCESDLPVWYSRSTGSDLPAYVDVGTEGR